MPSLEFGKSDTGRSSWASTIRLVVLFFYVVASSITMSTLDLELITKFFCGTFLAFFLTAVVNLSAGGIVYWILKKIKYMELDWVKKDPHPYITPIAMTTFFTIGYTAFLFRYFVFAGRPDAPVWPDWAILHVGTIAMMLLIGDKQAKSILR